jgi:hypothetical protein
VGSPAARGPITKSNMPFSRLWRLWSRQRPGAKSRCRTTNAPEPRLLWNLCTLRNLCMLQRVGTFKNAYFGIRLEPSFTHYCNKENAHHIKCWVLSTRIGLNFTTKKEIENWRRVKNTCAGGTVALPDPLGMALDGGGVVMVRGVHLRALVCGWASTTRW